MMQTSNYNSSNNSNSSNTEIKLQPSWLGKINWGLGCQGIHYIYEDNDKDKHKNNYMVDDLNEKYKPVIYNDRKTAVKNYNNKPYPDEYASLTYSISRISRHILGYREYHRYYLQPVIVQDIHQPIENNKSDGVNIANLETNVKKPVYINNINGGDEPDHWSDNELEPTFNDTILSDIDDYLEE